MVDLHQTGKIKCFAQHADKFGAGASLALEYAPGGVAGQLQGGTRESAVFRYSNYGLNLAAVYYNGHDTNPFTTRRENRDFLMDREAKP